MKNTTILAAERATNESIDSARTRGLSPSRHIAERNQLFLDKLVEAMFTYEDPAEAFQNISELKAAGQSPNRVAEILMTSVVNRQTVKHDKIATYVEACLYAGASFNAVQGRAENISRALRERVEAWGQTWNRSPARTTAEFKTSAAPAAVAADEQAPAIAAAAAVIPAAAAPVATAAEDRPQADSDSFGDLALVGA